MAIYHFHAQVISRSTGRSVVACAAYRSCERLLDARYGLEHDYTRKEGLVHAEILLPDHAPRWMAEREKLWNAVEAFEKRKDAQLAREFNISLVRELTVPQNLQLIRDFIKKECVSQGMIADLCVHEERASDGQSQIHAHVMLTLRPVEGEGFGKKERQWNDKAYLLVWRERWAEFANHQLALNGHDLRIDHRTLEAQGIPLEPQHRIGPTPVRQACATWEDHQRIARENGEKLLRDPNIVLEALTRQQSTFTEHDLVRYIHRYTVDAEQFERVHLLVKAGSERVSLGLDEGGIERYTTRQMMTIEADMIATTQALMKTSHHPVNTRALDETLANSTLSTQQQHIVRHVVGDGDVRCVVGYAGTGKSHLLGVARGLWENEGYRVRGATLSGIAAESLESSSGIESRTLASWAYRWGHDQDTLTDRDIVVIDEAGMLGSRQVSEVIAAVEAANAKIILIGDPQQLQSIEAGAAFRAITEHAPTCELTEIWRQRESWQRDATHAFAQGRTEEALKVYEERGHLHERVTPFEARAALLARWEDLRAAHPEESQLIFSFTRKDVEMLNHDVRHLRQQQGELREDVRVMTARGERHFALHERIYFLKNDSVLGVRNGTLGTITAIDEKSMRVCLDEGIGGAKGVRELTVLFAEYAHLDYGYAATIHKGQGITVDRSLILASKYMDRHATYVAGTRHRASVDFYWSHDDFSDRQELGRMLGRDRSKDVTMDYLVPDKNLSAGERDLIEFRRQFEAEHPELARQIREQAHHRQPEFAPHVAEPEKTLAREQKRSLDRGHDF